MHRIGGVSGSEKKRLDLGKKTRRVGPNTVRVVGWTAGGKVKCAVLAQNQG